MSNFQKRLEKDQKGMVRYIWFVLLISIGIGALTNYLVRATFCGVFAGIGAFFLIMLLVNWVTSLRFEKESVHTYATIKACERMEALGEGDGDDYYKITYEVMRDGEWDIVELPSYEKAKVGKDVGVYYIADKNILRTDSDMEDLRKNRGLKILTAVFLVIAVIAGVLENLEGELFTESFWTRVAVGLGGLVFLLFGVWQLSHGIRRKKELAHARTVSATLTRFSISKNRNSDGDSYNTYFPVWEYDYCGETREHKSTVSKSGRQEIGSISTIYITESGDVFEKKEAKESWGIAIVFTVLGVGLFAVMMFAPWG